MAFLLKFANDNDMGGDKFDAISLGQGQGPIAERLITKAAEAGTWVALQNCHLAVSWMNDLERICESFTPDTVHPDFRLWLTSYPSPHFPVAVLQNSAKMTNEPPDGLRQNMLQSYLNDPVSDPSFFNYFEETNPEKFRCFQKMLFGLTFFHAVVQERRGFGPIGWNIPYGFNESDFRISVMQLKIFFDEYSEVPYDALQYLTGECNYGGRVTDDWDRRCLRSILQNAYGRPTVETVRYQFSGDESFLVPPPDGYDSYIEFIGQLPAVPVPEVFGMHPNVDISKEQAATNTLFDCVLTTETKAGSGGGESGSMVEQVAAGILDKLPQDYDIADALKRFPTKYDESMNTVLVQEMQRFNRLTAVIRKTLINLQKALKGLVTMSSDLEDVATNLAVGRIPALWKKNSYPSLKPLGSYVTDLLRRLKVFSDWYDSDKPPNFWLPGFYFTQAFLTGALQNYARKYTIPIDILKFDFEVLRPDVNVDTPPEDGVYIHGLYLDGARWDTDAHRLADSLPKVLYEPMAFMHFKPAKQDDVVKGTRYDCPVYKTSDRRGMLSTTGHSTNFVLSVLVDSDHDEAVWVRRGLALLTQLDD